ncbi:lipoprotein [Hymenobacter koreensis]|uniref:Lipoprotein n=1 Tax=Hymenobacter koreensis TaxID=1084523 RepID=A0ABP8IXJ2_9BACT
MPVLGLLLAPALLPSCSTRTDAEAAGTATADSAEAAKPVVIDSVQLQAQAMRRDSLKADSIVKASGQLPGAILPGKRIIAFYGNIRAKGMGILGREPKEQMLAKFRKVQKEWQEADPSIPVQPALHSVTITAQAAAGKDGKYRLMNSKATIDETIQWAKDNNAIVFLDVQVGLSNLPNELHKLEPWLKDPIVHMGIDPEFAMETKGVKPGRKIGTYDAKDVNYAINFLARIVSENKLPPKILTVHRFTQGMVTNYKNIKLDPRVQVVMHMDGWGNPTLKKDSYKAYIEKQPVQYTGFKLFYEYDARPAPHHIMTAKEVLSQLNPKPLYIQYQ